MSGSQTASNLIGDGLNSPLWPLVVLPLAVLAVCGVLLLNITHYPMYYPWGDLGQTYWNYWWFDFGVVGQGAHPLRTDWLFHPIGGGLTFHTMGLIYCVLFWPVRAALGIAAGYNAQIVATYVLTMAFTYGLTRRLGVSRFAATLAGLGAGLGRYRFNFAFQMNILSTQGIPLYFWMLSGLLSRRETDLLKKLGLACDTWLAIGLGLAVVAMLASSWHYLLFCAILTPLFIGAAWLNDRRLFARRRLWRNALIALLVAAPVSAFYLLSAIDEARRFPVGLERSERARIDNSAALSDYLLTPPMTALVASEEHHPLTHGEDGRFIQRMFHLPGYMLALLAIVAMARRREPGGDPFGARFWGLVALSMVALSLGPVLHLVSASAPAESSRQIPLFYALLERLPVFRNVEQLYRFGYVVTLSLAVAGALGVEPFLVWLRLHRPRWRGVPIGVALALIVFVDCYAGTYRVSPSVPPAYATFLKSCETDASVLILPDHNALYVGQYMMEQSLHEKRLMGGYISRGNLRFDEFCETYLPIRRLREAVAGDFAPLDDRARADLLRQADRHRLRYVVLHLAVDCSKFQMRSTREWMLNQRLGAVVFEDETHCVIRLARSR